MRTNNLGPISRSSTPLSLALGPLFFLPVDIPDQMTPVLQTLHHFDSVTYCSMGSEMGQRIIRSCMHQLVADTPYLMHAINGVSAEHLCHLLPEAQHPVQHKQSRLAGAYHWQKALRLFREEIATGANPSNMDALISSVMMICVHQFKLTDSLPDPSKSFVFAPPEQRDEFLKWITIHHGFKAIQAELGDLVWQSVWNPVFYDSDFKDTAPRFTDPDAGDETHALFLDLCEITDESSPESSAYYEPLEYLLFVRQLPPSVNRFNKLVTFVATIEGQYLALLLKRDKRALLILVHWLALMSEIQQWWISGRVRAECVAITTFLMHDRDERMRRLLVFPARTVGLRLCEVEDRENTKDGATV